MQESDTAVSVVIPALNEARALPVNLERLCRCRADVEIFVVDGGSDDGTQDIVERCGDARVHLLSSAPGRGLQMNLGAQRAHGEWLLFHHADSVLSADALEKIVQLPAHVQWGGFRHCFMPGNWKLRLISALHNWRCGLTGVIYGDQSMFVRREFFAELGGFAEDGLEDLQFSDAALQHAQPHLFADEVYTDSRKFTQIGEFRALAQVLSILWRYEHERRLGNETFFKPYR